MRSGIAVVVVGIAYVVVLSAGIARHGFTEPIADPVLAVMELLTIASAVPIFTLLVALHATVGRASGIPARLSLACALTFALATTGVHLFELTVGRRMGSRGFVWPSASYAIELLAWDLLLGVALVLAARALRTDPGARRVRIGLRVTGVLCLAGIIGPAVGDMRLQLVGVLGYAVLLPVVAWMLVSWFRHTEEARG